jgi:ribose transport system substrate-binding protein
MNAPGSGSTMDREKGFEDVMAKEFPNIRIVARQFGMSDRAKARDAAENMLGAHPDLDGMFARLNRVGRRGAGHQGAGADRQGEPVAFDSTQGMIEDLKNGAIDAMVVQDPFRMGYQAVKTQVDHLHGITPPKRIDLSARVVTKPDLDKPDVKELLFPDLDKYLK